MNIIEQIKIELKKQNLSMTDLAKRMRGNTSTRLKDLSNILSYKRDPGVELLEEIGLGLGHIWNLKPANNLMRYAIIDKGKSRHYRIMGISKGKPTTMTNHRHPDLDHIRQELRRRGLINCGRQEGDDPSVIEVWVGEDIGRFIVL